MFFWGFLQFVQTKKNQAYRLCVSCRDTVWDNVRVLPRSLPGGIGRRPGTRNSQGPKTLGAPGDLLVHLAGCVPVAVRQRVMMTKDSSGQLEASAQERVDLWSDAEKAILADPIFGNGFGTYQYGQHVANLENPHNWYVQVLVETGAIGLIIALALVQQMFSLSYRLFRRGQDPLYRGLGLGSSLRCVVVSYRTALATGGPTWRLWGCYGCWWVLPSAPTS